MHSRSFRFSRVFLSTLLVASALTATAFAQTPQAATPPGEAENSATVGKRVTVAQALKAISDATGVIALADSNVADKRIVPPAEKATLENVEAQIAAVAEAAGRTAAWAKLYLPPGEYTGDDVAAFALAQSRLFGGTVGNAPSGTVEILGKAIPAARAKSYIEELNLKQVYLIASPRRSAMQKSIQEQWAGMNDAQRKQYARDQAKRLSNADPATLQAFMQEHMAVMRELMTSLTPDQRNQMFGPNVKVFVSPDGLKTGVQAQVIEVH
jgi:hypothetical protein